jgi:GT2 family glycosyltransferase
VELCRSPIVLFLDDDAEIGGGYIGGVAERFNADPDIVGIGGVDSQSLPKGASPLARRYMAFFALSGAGAGELSPSGLNYSQAFWRGSPEAFNSQFLHGCNMAFKASALSDLPVLPWLTGHAACEDLVLSYWAARHGALVVDPGLPILHHETPGGRGSVAQRLKRKLANQREFARLSQGRVPAVFLWSSFGLFLKDAALAMTGRHGRRGVPAVLNGYLSLLRNRTPQPTRHRDA